MGTEDLSVPAGARVAGLRSGHHPFLSRPGEFAAMIAAEVASAA